MKIQVQSKAFRPSPQLRRLIQDKVQGSLWAVQSHVRGVRVLLDDLNGPKGGVDSRCLLAVELAGCPDVLIEEVSESPFGAVAGAAKRAGQASLRRLKRLQSDRRRFA